MRIFIRLLLLSVIMLKSTLACTGIAVYRYAAAFFGNNEDYYKTNTYIEFLPAENGKYGRVYLGYTDIPGPQGGMNDRGLCFDGFATPYLEVVNSIHLPMLPGNIKEIMMETCATVEEVITLFSQYNLSPMANGQLLVSDRFGNAIIIEGDEIIGIEGDYLVCTNFYHSHPELGGWPCWRYNTSTQMLSELDSVLYTDIKDILYACHVQSGFSATTYSNIFDMNTGDIYLYCKNHFDSEVKLNLNDELQNGYSFSMIKDLFTAATVEDGFIPAGFILGQNYPNPFNPGTTIEYEIPQPEFVNLKVYDTLGNEVLTLVNEEKPAGRFTANFNTVHQNLSAGVYFYQLKTGSFVETKKMILLK